MDLIIHIEYCKRQLYNVGNRQFKIVGFPTFFLYFSYPLFRNGGIWMRKDIREGVKQHMIDGIKPNYAALATQYDCDYRTVKAAYQEALEGEKKPPKRKKRPSKLDPYKAIIERKLKDQCSAYSIFKFIEKKGFEGSYSLVKKYSREFKTEKIKKATIRIEHTTGLSAQVDWKEEVKLISNQGEIFTFNIFLYVLPYSKKKYITLTFDRKQDTLFSCLNDAFTTPVVYQKKYGLTT